MIGAIAGDVIGSVYEFVGVKKTDFPLFSRDSTFTDDTVLTVAVAEAIMTGGSYGDAIRSFGRSYPGRGYGLMFGQWLRSADSAPYGSWGNGSAMRVSAVGWAFDSEERVLAEAKRSAEVTHDHPEGIRGAQAVALAVFLARTGAGKPAIRSGVEALHYRLDQSVDEMRPRYTFQESCAGSVPQAITCFLESRDFEEAVRLAVSMGGDSDTMACIAGAIAEAHYGEVPASIATEVLGRLDPGLRDVVERFHAWRSGPRGLAG